MENLKRQNDDDDSSRSNIIRTSTTSSRCSSPREKEKKEESCRLWSKVKYQLVKFEALPEYLRDNEYIRGHYRLNWPLGPTLLSLFSFHNETLNIWTYVFRIFCSPLSMHLSVSDLLFCSGLKKLAV